MDHTNGSYPANSSAQPGGDFHADSSAGWMSSLDTGSLVPGLGVQETGTPSGHKTVNSGRTADPECSFASPREHSSVLTPDEPIEFRVARGAAPTRRLRLTGNRYTFGSAEGCSIRLSDPKLRPMHAVLIREPSRLIVRAYSVPILVNEVRVTETTLKLGDRLRLGEYEFELLSLATSEIGVDPVPSPASNSANPGRIPESYTKTDQVDAMPASTRSTTGATRLPTDETAWRERLRKEIDQWRHRQVQCDQREQRIDEREAHLRGRESELWSRSENLYRRESQLQDQESAVYQLHDEYAERQQELSRLREGAQNRDDSMRQREAEFAHQEVEYQTKLKEATEQLLQSRCQAETATDAVARMRAQFDSLNQQIEDLSSQQERIRDHEVQEREQHQQLRHDLEEQRDQAIDAKAESEAYFREAQSRAERLEQEVIDLHESRDSHSDQDRANQEENEQLVAKLSGRVATLQSTADNAETESSRLRSDYQGALASVAQLELLVAQSNERGDQDRADWASQADQLRDEINKLSDDLKRTSDDLENLRQANETLTTRLHDVQVQRDDALELVETRPTHEAFDSLRSELEEASSKLEQMRTEIADAQNNAPADIAEPHADADWSHRETPKLDDSSSLNDPSIGEDPTSENVSNRDLDASGPCMTVGFSSGETQEFSEPVQAPERLDLDSEDQETEPDNVADAPSALVGNNESLATDADAWPTYQSNQESPSSDSPEPEGSRSQTAELQTVDPQTPGPLTADPWSRITHEEPVQESLEAEPESSPWMDDHSTHESLEDHGNLEDDETPEDQGESEDAVWSSATSLSSGEGTLDDLTTDQDSFSQDSESSGLEATRDAFLPTAQLPTDNIPSDPWNADNVGDHQEESGAAIDSSEESSDDKSLANQLINELESEDSDERTADSDHDSDIESSYQGTQAWSSDESTFDDVPSQLNTHSIAPDPTPQESGDFDLTNEEESPATSQSPSGTMAWDQERSSESLPEESIPESMNAWSDDASKLELEESDPENPYATAWADQETEPTVLSASDLEREAVESSEREPMVSQPFMMDDVAPSGLDQPELETELEPEAKLEQATDPAVGESDSEEDDDSIEAYMNRLLRRVQGAPTEGQVADPSSVELSTSVSLDSHVTEDKVDESVPLPEPIDPSEPLVPRSQAPESDLSLSAMRELANESARNAISRSSRIQTRNMQLSAVFNFGGVGIAIIFGLIVSWWLQGQAVVVMVVWVMITIISAVMVREGLKNLAEAKLRRKRERQANQEAKNDNLVENAAKEPMQPQE